MPLIEDTVAIQIDDSTFDEDQFTASDSMSVPKTEYTTVSQDVACTSDIVSDIDSDLVMSGDELLEGSVHHLASATHTSELEVTDTKCIARRTTEGKFPPFNIYMSKISSRHF